MDKLKGMDREDVTQIGLIHQEPNYSTKQANDCLLMS